jgi:uncharacterized protein
MSFTLYDAGVPATIQILSSISAVLDKAASYCEEKKINPSVLVDYRLAPDMLPLSSQIQIMSDHAKGMAVRLAGAENPSYADTETTLPELQARIAKTLAFVKSFTREQIDGAEDKEITLKLAGNEVKLSGRQYLVNFMLPNFYFHAATAYDILRHAGVPLGKRDFLGSLGA